MPKSDFGGRRYEIPVDVEGEDNLPASRPRGEVSPFAPLDYLAGRAGIPHLGRLLDGGNRSASQPVGEVSGNRSYPGVYSTRSRSTCSL